MNPEQVNELNQLATNMEQAQALLSQVNAALVQTLDYQDPDDDLRSRLIAAQNGLENEIDDYPDLAWLMNWLPDSHRATTENVKPWPNQSWADHVITGLKNPKFFQRKVGDLSIQELQAIKSQWLPMVRQVWDQVNANQKADAEAFKAAIAAKCGGALRGQHCVDSLLAIPSPPIPPEDDEVIEQLTTNMEKAKALLSQINDVLAKPIDYYYTADGNLRKRLLYVHDSLEEEINRYSDERIVDWPNVPEHIKANLKRLCPYVGSNLPQTVREKAEARYGPNPEKSSGCWHWENGSDHWQYELVLCDMDGPEFEPAAYAAIRPIGRRKWLLSITADADGDFDPGEDLVFSDPQAAKSFLDQLLAAATPAIPEHQSE
jgi:hypothetical protein